MQPEVLRLQDRPVDQDGELLERRQCRQPLAEELLAGQLPHGGVRPPERVAAGRAALVGSA